VHVLGGGNGAVWTNREGGDGEEQRTLKDERLLVADEFL
jgi:hypothetical protein